MPCDIFMKAQWNHVCLALIGLLFMARHRSSSAFEFVDGSFATPLYQGDEEQGSIPLPDGGGTTDDVVSNDPNVLNVHVVPHTHDDVGWLKTVEQYYYGLNGTISGGAVKYILDSTIRALEDNPDRKFTYVEMAFFTIWWNHQSETKRESVKRLVSEGRLSFANGGWCMHDEAATHFMGMIDQTTLGHSFLKETFNFTPRVGWQLDPFGHSSTHASLLSAEVGFDSLFFGRIDYQDLELRQNQSRCEGIWEGSASLGSEAQVFWGLSGSYRGNYQPPVGFDFNQHDAPLVDGINIDERVSDFVHEVAWQGERTRGNNIMLTMGSDFQYENSMENFDKIDGLIKYVMQYQADGKIDKAALGRFDAVNVFYSNPEMYTAAKHAEGITDWEVKYDDFFPYSHCANCFWTGYFTSRAALKRLERVGSSFLHMARQIEAVDGRSNVANGGDDRDLDRVKREDLPLYALDAAVGVAQHHDGVSGTSKQHVAYDYARRIDSGVKEASRYVGETLGKILGGSVDLVYCQDLNVTICETTQAATRDTGTDMYIVAYNALSAPRKEVISIPVSIDATYAVYNIEESGSTVKSVLIPNSNPSYTEGAAPYALYIDTGAIAPLGTAVFHVVMVSKDSSAVVPSKLVPECKKDSRIRTGRDQQPSTVIENSALRLSFESASGLLEQIQHNGVSYSVEQKWGYYTSFASKKTAQEYQNSGAYIFRPETPNEELNRIGNGCVSSTLYQSDLVTEIHSNFSSWVKQILRMKRDASYVEVEYTVGPIPIEDGKGREVVTRYSTSIRNNGTFYTDANGREFIDRKRGFRKTWVLNETQPIAGNYYPVNAAIYIEDDESSLSVMTDRSQGGSSLVDGSIELMVHRRNLADDSLGVGEPLNETDAGMTPYPPYGNKTRLGKGLVITGMHRVMAGAGRVGATNARSQMDKSFSPLQLFFGSAPSGSNVPFKRGSSSAIQAALPENVMLITLAKIHSKPGSFLVRIGHQYGIDEGPLAVPVKVDMATVFPRQNILSMEEKTLSGNQDRSSWEEKRLRWDVASIKAVTPGGGSCSLGVGTSIQIAPMKICTFEVSIGSVEEIS